MAHAVELFLDPDSERTVRQLWARLEDAGIASPASLSHRRHRPHVTFLYGPDLSAHAAQLRTALRSVRWEPFTLGTVGTFPPRFRVLFLGVIVYPGLLGLQAKVHRSVPAEASAADRHSVPGRWVPHCTLAKDLDPDRLGTAIAALGELDPILVRPNGVGLVDTRSGAIESIAETPTRGLR